MSRRPQLTLTSRVRPGPHQPAHRTPRPLPFWGEGGHNHPVPTGGLEASTLEASCRLRRKATRPICLDSPRPPLNQGAVAGQPEMTAGGQQLRDHVSQLGCLWSWKIRSG